jgi:hypothetical protein
MGCEVCRGLSRASASECVRVRRDRELRRAHVRIRRMRGETSAKLPRGRVEKECVEQGLIITIKDANPWVS